MDNYENITLPDENAAAKRSSATADVNEAIIPTSVTDKKKKKGKMAAVIIIAVLVPLISAFTILSVIGVIVISELRSPEKAIMNMLEDGKYDQALARYHHEFSEEGASEELIDLLKDRTDELLQEIQSELEASLDNKQADKDITELPALDELMAIMDMDIPEVEDKLRSGLFREIFALLFGGYTLPDNLTDIPYIFDNIP